jgi:hypothetical protein
MDVNRMLADLRQEKIKIDAAIHVIEQLAVGGKRRGRPPAWMTAQRKAAAETSAVATEETTTTRKNKKKTGTKRVWSRAQREAASERMKKMHRTKKREAAA